MNLIGGKIAAEAEKNRVVGEASPVGVRSVRVALSEPRGSMLSRKNETAYRAAEAKLFTAYDVEPMEHWIDVPGPGAGIRVLETGSGSPVVFVHGSPNGAATWIPLAAALPGHRCLMIERPGAGLSGPVESWGNHRKATTAVLEAVLDTLSCGPVDVVGSSLGGLYAYNLALESPTRVHRIVQMGFPAGPDSLPMPAIFRILSIPVIPLLGAFGMRPDPEKTRGMFREIGHGHSVDAGVIPDVMYDWYSSLLCHTDTLLHLLGEIRAIATPLGFRRSARISETDLHRLEPPVLYLWGDQDNFATPEQAERLASLTRGAAIERFSTAGHLPWLDDPNGIAERLVTFCTDEEPPVSDQAFAR
jgi:2-hydroxy-6-oxonona-2,4-dienedioate hydrolase